LAWGLIIIAHWAPVNTSNGDFLRDPSENIGYREPWLYSRQIWAIRRPRYSTENVAGSYFCGTCWAQRPKT
jgi:hypothetical protein